MEIQGTILVIGETQELGSNGFKKRDLVIKTEEQYPQFILIDFLQDKTTLLDSVSINDTVKISINLRGRQWTNPQGETKYFNSINGWRIEKINENKEPSTTFEQAIESNMSEPDDLPF